MPFHSFSPGKLFAVLAGLLLLVAFLSPDPHRQTDRSVYETIAAQRIAPDCTELHCFRVLVAWTLGALPGPSVVKWKVFAALSNAGAAVALARLCSMVGLPGPVAELSAWAAAFGFGSLYTLFDPFSSDPLMYLMGPLLTILLLRGRLASAGWMATVGVLAKEFAVVPLFVFALAAAMSRRWSLVLRTLVASNAALLVWLALQFWLMLRYNYGYGDSPSTHLASGGYLKHWLDEIGPRGAASSLFTEYGAIWLLAPAGLVRAPRALRQLALSAIPAALLFAYVQQPDRALWNFHYLMIPMAMLVAASLPAWGAWGLVGCFAAANLRLGAQLPFVPVSRLALLASVVIAAAAIARNVRSPAPLAPAEALAL
jgi:hypothetical protein